MDKKSKFSIKYLNQPCKQRQLQPSLPLPCSCKKKSNYPFATFPSSPKSPGICFGTTESGKSNAQPFEYECQLLITTRNAG